jgi:hypothetical protein
VPHRVVGGQVERVDRVELVELLRRQPRLLAQLAQRRLPRRLPRLDLPVDGSPRPRQELAGRPPHLE